MRIQVSVDANGVVQAERWDNHGRSPTTTVGLAGLDAELVRLFMEWLALRERYWREREIKAFGSLLFRCLFPDRAVWDWVQAVIDQAEGTVRVELVFPAEGPFAALSAIPWEYLYRPERAGRRGAYLAAEKGLILSRYIPTEEGQQPFPPLEHLNVLVVISMPADPRLGPVDYQDVLDEITRTSDGLGFTLTVLRQPTIASLNEAMNVAGRPQHLVHFMGHGRFDAASSEAAVALTDPDDGLRWVDDRTFSELLTRNGAAPRAVVLHSCEGGVADYSASFAGMAPQLVRNGTQSVIAMQYPVTNETAILFSTCLYDQLARGADLDTAAQEARWKILRFSDPADPRLVGVPVVYLQNEHALLDRPAPVQ
ncbi:CHAT domain-containing protein [Jatrophihabitans sp.]|uniref:CHAT domain-containing protein n=1 Tax=Jatrophihabitans sp. TaxID=1932789 RepID=UPI002C027CD7|nr:CHAT domain-containing protein [Jatrophihabitans sp.]